LFNIKCISDETQEKISQRVFMVAVIQEFSDYPHAAPSFHRDGLFVELLV
jgi:hypothetical protein